MKRNRPLVHRLLCALLCACILVSVLPSSMPVAQASSLSGARAYTFHCPGAEVGKDEERTMYYTDNYFSNSKPATEYNPSLATATLCLAMSAFGSNTVFDTNSTISGPEPTDYIKAPRNWYELLGKLGFQDIYTNPYFSKQPTDTVGVNAATGEDYGIAYGIAYKLISDEQGGAIPLIAVGVRGSNYQSEWAGNVTVGDSGHHKGFYDAATNVINGVKTYISGKSALNGKSVKLWITGFSRAAATSNMVAGRLDDAIADDSITATLGATLVKENLYCYTFETPAGSAETDPTGVKYSNIFNLINPNDLVPMVAPYFSGTDDFRRYGTDLLFPSTITCNSTVVSQYEGAAKAAYQKLGFAYTVDQFKNWRLHRIYKNESPDVHWLFVQDLDFPQSSAFFCGRFLNELIHGGIGTRQDYADKYQASFQTLMGFLCGAAQYGTAEQSTAFMKYLTDNKVKILSTIVWNVLFQSQGKSWEAAIKDAALSQLKAARAYAKLPESNLPTAKLEAVAQSLTTALMALWHEGVNKGYLAIRDNINLVASFVYNASYVLQAHDPDLALAWLSTMDSNYAGNAALSAAPLTDYCSEYRIVRLKGNVNSKMTITVNGVEKELPAAYTGGEVGAQDIDLNKERDSILTLYCVPANATGTLEITRPGPGFSPSPKFFYQVGEYSPVVGDVKGLAAYTVSLDSRRAEYENYVYKATFPAYGASEQKSGNVGALVKGGAAYQLSRKVEGTSESYAAVSADWRTFDLSDLRANYATLKVMPNNGFGYTMGGGQKRILSYADIVAYENEDGEFVEWSDTPDPIDAKYEKVRTVVVPHTGIFTEPYIASFAYAGKPDDVQAYNSGIGPSAPAVTVTWQETTAANTDLIEQYRIYRTEGTTTTLLAEADKDVFQYIDTSVAQGTTYTYTVCAVARDPVSSTVSQPELVESKGVSDTVTIGTAWTLTDTASGISVSGYSSDGTVPVLTVTPTAQNDPQNRKMKLLQGSQYLDSWTLALTNSESVTDGYQIVFPVVGMADGQGVSVQQDAAPNDAQKTVAFYAGETSSGKLSIQTQDVALGQFFLTTLALPGAPQNATAYNTAQNPNSPARITVAWQKPAPLGEIDGYHIYRDGRLAGTVNGENVTSFIDRTPAVGSAYTYTVAAFNAHGEGPKSNGAVVTVAVYWSFTEKGVTVSGYSVTNVPTGILVEALAEGDPRLRHFTVAADQTVVSRYEVKFLDEEIELLSHTQIRVSLPVPSYCNGATLNIQHDMDSEGAGDIERFTAAGAGGLATVMVDRLSPFQVSAPPKPLPPVTGDAMPLALIAFLLALALGGMAALSASRKRRGRGMN